MSNFRGRFFHDFGVKIFLFFWKHYSVRTKKLHNKFCLNFLLLSHMDTDRANLQLITAR